MEPFDCWVHNRCIHGIAHWHGNCLRIGYVPSNGSYLTNGSWGWPERLLGS